MSLEKIRPRVVDETGNYTFNNVTATGTLVSANANLGNIARANYVSTNNLLYANGVAWAFSAGSVVGADTQVQYNDGGSSFGASSAFTFNKTSSTLSVTNITANGSGLTSLTGANVTGTVANATYATSAGTATSATTAGTVTTASQSNITSVGTLTSLAVTGNVTSGNANLGNVTVSNYFSGNGYHLTGITGGAIVGTVSAASVAYSVDGANVVGQVTYAATANAVAAGNVMGQIANALVAGTVYTAAQTNITSVGTLTSLDVTGNVSANYYIGNGSQLTGITITGAYSNTNTAAYLPTYTGNISANYFIGNGSALTNITGANIIGNVSSAVQSHYANVANSITGTNVSGNVASAVQSHYANIANSVTFTNVSGKPTTISGYGITDAYSNTNTAAYLTANPVTGTYSNTNTAAYLAVYTGNLTAGNANITGNLVVGNLSTIGSGGNLSGANYIIANYFVGNGAFLTGVDLLSVGNADIANSIANGTSNINTPVANGNITVSIGGTANTVVFANSGNYIVTTGNVKASHYFGDGSQLTGITGTYSNTNTAAYLPIYTGNFTAGNINLSYTTTSTANLGNAVRANYFVGNGAFLTGVDLLTVGNADIANAIANGNSNISTPYGNGPITVSITGTSNTVIFTSTGVNVAGTLNVGGNVIVGNLTVNGTTTTVNSTTTRVIDPIFELGGGANGAALSADDNKDRGLLLHYYSGSSTVDAFMGWDDSTNEFGFGSNVSVSSEVVTFNSYANVRGNYFVGNGYYLTGVDQLAAGSADIANSIANGTSNINTPYQDGPITVGVGGAANAVVFTSTGINIAGYSNIGGTVTAGTGTGGSITGANAITSNYFIGTLTTAAQPNITSVGTLTSLTAGNINLSYTTTSTANLGNAVRANYFVGNGAFLTGVDLLSVGNADIANSIANGTSNINTPTANGNITVTIGGTANTVVFANTGNYITTTGNMKASYYFGDGSQLTGITGTYSNTNTAAYLTANPQTGTYSNTNVASYLPTYTGNLTAGNINLSYTTTSTANLGNAVRANYFVGNGAFLTGVDLLSVGNADIANSIANGTSNINTPTSNGNITVTIGGTANTVIFTSTGINVAGYISPSTGNGTNGIIWPSNPGGGSLDVASIKYYAVTGEQTRLEINVQNDTPGVNQDDIYFTTNSYVVVNSTMEATSTSVAPFQVLGGVGIAKKLFVGGNIEAGTNFVKGNGYYLTGVDQLSVGNADIANSIANGTSNINTPTAGGNITVGIGGIANTAIFTTSGITASTFTGNLFLSVSGTTNAAIVSANVAGSDYFRILVGGTATDGGFVEFATADNGNEPIYFRQYNVSGAVGFGTVARTLTLLDASGDTYVPGKLTTTGNIIANAGSFFLGNGYYLTGVDQLSVGNADIANSIANGTSNINTPVANGNITVSIGGTANTVVFANTGNYITTTGNMKASYYFGDGSQLTGIAGSYSNTNVASYLTTYTGNLTAGNINLSYTTTSTANLGNAVRANYFVGNAAYLTGVDLLTTGGADVANSIANGTSNINTPVSNGNITVTIAGVANTVVFTSTGMNVIGNITTTGSGGNLSGANYVIANYFTGNGSGITYVTGTSVSGNVSSAVQSHYANIANSVAGANVSGQVANALVAGTVYTAAQTNITSVGTLTSLVVTGNITGGNANLGNAVTANFFIGDGSQLTGITGTYSNTNTAAYLTANPQTGTYSNTNTAAYLTANPQTGTYSNTNTAAYLPTYTGNFTAGNINLSYTTTSTANLGNAVTANFFIGDGSQLTGIVGSYSNTNVAAYLPTYTGNLIPNNITLTTNADIVLSGTGSVISGANLISGNYLTGTLTTAAQPNITSVSTLTSLTVGNATANTVFGNGTITATGNISFTGANVSLGSTSSVRISGGAANYFLKTDGTGNLSWATPSGGVGGTSLTYTTATSPPASGNLLGDQWFNTSSNVLYEYLNDGTAAYWVDISSPSTSTNSAIAGAIVIKDEGSNISTAVSSINFVGAGVTASNVGNAVTVTVTATTDTLSPFLLMGA